MRRLKNTERSIAVLDGQFALLEPLKLAAERQTYINEVFESLNNAWKVQEALRNHKIELIEEALQRQNQIVEMDEFLEKQTIEDFNECYDDYDELIEELEELEYLDAE